MDPLPEEKSAVEVHASDLDRRIVKLGEVVKAADGRKDFYGYLTAVLGGIYESRRSLVEDVKHTTTLLTSICGAGAVAASVGFDRIGAGSITVGAILLTVAALVFLALARAVTPAERQKISASYELYISACIHAACVHKAVELPLTHKWLEWGNPDNAEYVGTFADVRFLHGPKDQLRCQFTPTNAAGSRKPKNLTEMMAAWRYYEPNLMVVYSKIIDTVKVAAYVAFTIIAVIVAMLCFSSTRGLLVQNLQNTNHVDRDKAGAADAGQRPDPATTRPAGSVAAPAAPRTQP